MSLCPKCNSENAEDANFCSRCGARLSDSDSTETTVTFAPVEIEEPTRSTTHKVRRGEIASLLVKAGGGQEGERVSLDLDALTIGRSPRSDLFLDDFTVSRHHARVIKDISGYMVEDLNSLNGTYVNRRRIERHRLTDGDELQIGKFKLAFIDSARKH